MPAEEPPAAAAREWIPLGWCAPRPPYRYDERCSFCYRVLHRRDTQGCRRNDNPSWHNWDYTYDFPHGAIRAHTWATGGGGFLSIRCSECGGRFVHVPHRTHGEPGPFAN